MKNLFNPYANALDGLVIKNPVSAFYKFCKERENIRIKRESNLPAPWTKDPILRKGRFLNVFREDDRVSKAIINFVKNLENDLPSLINALFFARWCNRQETLDSISTTLLLRPEKLFNILTKLNPWCNLTAYPVEKIHWGKKKYSRLDAATKLFGNIKEPLTNTILKSKGNVIKATEDINSLFKMKNNFPIFMAIIDIAWFRPDVISPQSHVPTGIGAVAYLDRLQNYLNLKNHQETCEKMIDLQNDYWPEAKRNFLPIDIEYLSCECRKYYSYINKTKLFKGKNSFSPKY